MFSILFLALAAATPKDATVYGFKIHYVEAGSGAPVILLHGLGGDASRWAPNIESLSQDFRVIVPDQIGFGQSDRPLANYHAGMLADFLVGLMKQIGIEKATLVGNSMGAGVACYTAVHYPERVDRLVLVDGAGYRRAANAPPPDPGARRIQNGVTLAETRDFLKILWHDDSRITDKMVEDFLTQRLKCAFTITKMQEAGERSLGGVTEDEMRGIKAPTLIIWGKYDALASPQGADRLNRDIAGSRKVLIDNAGHLPQLEKPSEFNQIVRDFLKGASPTQ